MTVVAAFNFPGHPMMLGDMLLSGPEVAGRSTAIPSIGDVRNFFPEGSGWTITGLAQKLVILSDDCVVGWAGSKLGATLAVNALRELASREKLTPANIKSCIDGLSDDLRNIEPSLIGLVRTEQGFESFSYSADLEIAMADSTPVLLAGSGTESIAKSICSSRRSRIRESDGALTMAENAFELGLQISGMHLRMEEASKTQLLHYFGGLYEIVVYNGQRFAKERGVTYVLWQGKDHDANGIARPDHVITTNYIDDVLVFRSQKLTTAGSSSFEIGEVQLQVVNPIYRKPDLAFKPTLSTVNQKTPWICHCFIVQHPDGKRGQLAMVQRPNYDGLDTITIEERNGVVVNLGWKAQFWYDVIAAFERFRQ